MAPLNRDDSRPCPVATVEYDWGNVCPADPDGLGVHRCELPAGHDRERVDTAEPATDCICRCGTRRLAGQPKRRTGA